MEQAFDWAAIPSLSGEQAKTASHLRQRLPGLLQERRALLPMPPGLSDQPQLTGIVSDWTLPAEQSVGFRLRGDGLDLQIRVAGPLALASVDAVLGAAQDQSRPNRSLTNIELGIFEYQLLDWISALRQTLEVLPFPVLSDLASPALGDEGAGPVVTLQGRGEQVAGQIQVRLNHCPERADAARGVSRQSPLFALPFELAVVVSHATLSAEELDSVEPGDVIVLDAPRAAVSDDGQLSGFALLAAPGAAPRATLAIGDDDQFEITDIDFLEAAMSEPNEDPADLADTIASDVELTLAAELGRLRVSLAHVSSYDVGSLIKLGKPIGAEVDLTLAGRLVGRGELLNVDGELGVRVSRWSV